MSQKNLETVRRMVDLANRGDVNGIVELMAPDVVCVPAAEQPDSEPFRGRDAFAEYAREWLAAFDQYVIEVSEYLDLGDYVIVVGRVVARGWGSGAETAGHDAWLYRFRDGLVVEYRACGTKTEALQIAGRAA